MAEPQRVSSPATLHRPAPKPRPRHPTRYAAPLRLPLEETQDLSPSAPRGEAPLVPVVEAGAPGPRKTAEERPAARERRAPAARKPGERVLMVALLLGLGLNAGVLLFDSALTRADVLLGSTVLLAGGVLLATLEICRRAR
ncbi:MAG TPA: hypothetical protein VHC97_07830 [Thermoanaerobaculia bacterium]|nr:hypothetical protein [Thermoanaerobaculia bacterium]